jgi:hypothetical protein
VARDAPSASRTRYRPSAPSSAERPSRAPTSVPWACADAGATASASASTSARTARPPENMAARPSQPGPRPSIAELR